MRFKSCNNNGMAPWSDLNHDVLYLVMMRLVVVDLVAFSGVCKSWRSLALCNRKMFLASRPPLLICKSFDANDQEECTLKDFEGRKFKTIIPHLSGRNCIGSTCGYLILYGKKTKDFLLVNPITRHQLHFLAFPRFTNVYQLRPVLVFSPSIPRWVFIIANKHYNEIWFSIPGKEAWDHVISTTPILDLHVFKGKIYTIDYDNRLCELTLDPKPNLTLHKIEPFLKTYFSLPQFLKSGENLYVVQLISKDLYEVYELDFGKMKWVLLEEKTIEEHAFFLSLNKYGVAVKPELWAFVSSSQYKIYDCFPHTIDISQKGRNVFSANMWYFPHLSLDVDQYT